MRRFVTSIVLLLFAIPFGASISGCHHAAAPDYCNGENSGVIVGQTTTVDLEPRLTGISLNQGEIGQANQPSAKDCRGNTTGSNNAIYASSNMNLVDVVPTTGRLCAGSWNRNTGGGIPDFTTCTPTRLVGTAYLTASVASVVSNPIPVYVHPIVTSIVLGPASTNCVTDPASNCTLDATQTNGCSAAPPTPVASVYTGLGCVSQGFSSQFVARTYQGTNTGLPANNISCLVGPLSFSASNASVVTIDTNGLATAAQPGATLINANTSQASSTAGFFSTCPPASIVLSAAGAAAVPPTSPITVNQNTTQSLVATVTDTNNNPITTIPLTYVSTTPTTIPAQANTVVPPFPGSTAITAVCQPPTCNSSPFDEIGIFGNGLLVTSNPVQINAVGTNFSTVLYMASTNSQYLLPYDFTLTTQSVPIRLPYAPNSLQLSTDLTTIYMGTPIDIMIFSTPSNSLTKEDSSISGTVLAVSQDSNTVVVTDPVRQLIYLYNSGGSITAEYGGVATRASISPDSSTFYITTTDGRLLVYSTFTGWTSIPLTTVATDVTVTIPNAGAYLAETTVADVRTVCPITTVTGTGINQITTNTFYPSVGPVTAAVNRVLATNDGLHIFGANSTSFTDIVTNKKAGSCVPNPIVFTSTPKPALNFAAAVPNPAGVSTSIDNSGGIANLLVTSDAAFGFVTFGTPSATLPSGTVAAIPQYNPATGVLAADQLKTYTGVPVAAVSAVISGDNNTLYVGTTGDNLVHRLARGTSGFADTLTPINPALPLLNGTSGQTATPNLLAQKPRKSTT